MAECKGIQIHPTDTVAVALTAVSAGTVICDIEAVEDIPQGHKIALGTIKTGDKVIKYGFPIGHATQDISAGAWVHEHNMTTDLIGTQDYAYELCKCMIAAVKPLSFEGYLRPNGDASIRNEIWVIPTVGCVNDIIKSLVRENQDLVKGSIDGLYAFTHPFGCSQTGDDHANTRKLLAALAKHPNAAAVLVVGLGCENLTMDQFKEELGDYDPARIWFCLQQAAAHLLAHRHLL